MKKKIISLILTLMITKGYAATGYINYTSTEEYFKNCEHAPFDKGSGCYVYFSGIIDTITLVYNNKQLCINDSDRDIYKKVMKIATQYLRRQPAATIYTSTTILAHSLINAYACNPRDRSQLIR